MIKLYLDYKEYDYLSSLRPEHGLSHATLKDAKNYYQQQFNKVDEFMLKHNLRIESTFVHVSREKGYIEVEGDINGSKMVIHIIKKQQDFIIK